MIPTVEECEALLDNYKVFHKVRAHSNQVMKVAVLLAKALKEKGEDVNVDLVYASAILHDLLRCVDFENDDNVSEEEVKVYRPFREKYKGMHHGIAVKLELTEYPEVGEVISKHGSWNILEGKVNTWEEKIVFYADKRVLHDTIVSVNERYEDSKIRHTRSKNQDKTKAAVLELEKEIFEKLDFNPEDIKEMIENE